MAQPSPSYDFLDAIERNAPGVIVQRNLVDAVATEYAANAYQPLTAAQVLAITGSLPSYPTGLPRFPDSNPDPREG